VTDRRSFLFGASVLMGHAAFGDVARAFAAAKHRAAFFAPDEFATLRTLVDVILPATDSPAASAADTHYFIDTALPACGSDRAQFTFRAGLSDLITARFVQLGHDARVALLKARAAKDVELPYDESFFKILKDYTLTGYFLSELGATQALAYERIPGGFEGDVPLRPGQKAWAIQ
jgi:hypothetical protein